MTAMALHVGRNGFGPAERASHWGRIARKGDSLANLFRIAASVVTGWSRGLVIVLVVLVFFLLLVFL